MKSISLSIYLSISLLSAAEVAADVIKSLIANLHFESLEIRGGPVPLGENQSINVSIIQPINQSTFTYTRYRLKL